MTQHHPHQYLLVLASYFIAAYVISLYFTHQIVGVHGWLFTRSTPLYATAVVCLDIVTEVYGYKTTRQLIWLGIVMRLLAGIYAYIAIRMPTVHSLQYASHAAFVTFSPSLRTAIAATSGIIVGQFLNSYLISRWKVMLKGRYFWMRSIGSTCIGEIVAAMIAIAGSFSGSLNLSQMLHLAIPDIGFLLVASTICVIPATIIVTLLKKAEGVNWYDTGINYNPFR